MVPSNCELPLQEVQCYEGHTTSAAGERINFSEAVASYLQASRAGCNLSPAAVAEPFASP